MPNPQIKYDKPLKLSEIPTLDQVHVIDNYSPNFNYIVEGSKVYYARKGNDYWVDISDNNTARINLLNFLKDKYDFRGYGDEEREIYNQIKNNTFDYNTYFNNKYNSKNSTQDNTVQEKKSVKPKPLPQNSLISRDYKEKNVDLPFGTYRYKEEEPLPGPIYGNYGSKSAQSEQKPSASKINGLVDWMKNSDSGTLQDLGHAIQEQGVLSGVMDTLKKGLQRWRTKRDIEEDPISFLPTSNFDPNSQYEIIPASFVGDTVKAGKWTSNPRQYILPESINVNEHTFGFRNHGDYRPITTEGAVITNHNPYIELTQDAIDRGYITIKGSPTKFKTVIGISPDGKLNAGPVTDFHVGDMVAGTWSNEIYGFPKDSTGHYIYKSDGRHGNSFANIPMAMVYDENTGEIRQGYPFNVLTAKVDPEGKTYGGSAGGRFLVRVGNELRLLSGSTRDIIAEYENMKRRQNAESGTFYTLDNGYYNKGLRTFDGKLTSQDLRQYEKGPSGHFAYIIGNIPQQFRSDTTWTPNIRTVNDDSYKKGHGLENELKGVLLHYTATANAKGAEDIFMNRANVNKKTGSSDASAHVVIDTDGSRKIFAEPSQVTWHAGKSTYNGRDEANDFMLGIEFQAAGPNQPLTDAQLKSAVEYLLPIIRENNISLEDITTHKKVRDEYIRTHPEDRETETKQDLSDSQYNQVLNALIGTIYSQKKNQ